MSEPVPANLTTVLKVNDLSVCYGMHSILKNVHFELRAKSIFGLLGPSGAGKSTLLRCLNRLLELQSGFQVTGEILFHRENILSSSVDPDMLRSKIGMIFQQPIIFPTSIERNVLFGASRLKRLARREIPDLVEKSLREAALWDQVKDRLHSPGKILSIGQQQRLCLARTLATDPEVVLMDEPTSALDPRTTAAIEELILQLRQTRAVVLVTHNGAQADRLCDHRLSLS